MKKLFLLLFVLICVRIVKSQDQLFKKDGSKLMVKVLEINSTEIKYKLFENQNGPTMIEDKVNVVMIIYQEGKYEMFNTSSSATPSYDPMTAQAISRKKDSLTYYKYSNNISINFLNFFNSEIGVIYQKEFFSSNFNVIIPLAVGLAEPYVTDAVWFNDNQTYYSNNGYSTINLDRKLYEVGLGINYYPNPSGNFNYFIGPAFRFMQFDATQTFHSQNYQLTSKAILVNRYSMTITNGITLRTKSRLTSTLFCSLGFKNDFVPDPITNPTTNQPTDPISNPVSLNVWLGFNVGFNF